MSETFPNMFNSICSYLFSRDLSQSTHEAAREALTSLHVTNPHNSLTEDWNYFRLYFVYYIGSLRSRAPRAPGPSAPRAPAHQGPRAAVTQ